MGTILTILQWAIPSGGIGAAIAWLANRKVARAKAAKEIHDTYKEMYQDVSELLIKVQKENEKCNEKIETLTKESERTRRAITRLSRAVEAIQLCPHRSSCPVRDELSVDEDGGETGNGKNRHSDGDKNNVSDDSIGHGQIATDSSGT